jgi:hypothetical protein
LGPLVVGLVLLLTGGPALRRDLRDRLLNPGRIRPLALLAGLVLPPLIMAASIGASTWFGEPATQFRLSTSENLVGMVILALVLAPIIEEIGWRGYGVDSLRSRWGMLPATLLFGVLWAGWHAPLVLVEGTYQRELAQMENPLFLANFFLSVVPAAVVANWVYYRNNRSIIASIGFHAVVNAAAVFPSAGQIAKSIATVFFLAVALVLIVLDRIFAEGPRDFVHSAPAPAPATASVPDLAADREPGGPSAGAA